MPRTILFLSHTVGSGGAEHSLAELVSALPAARYTPRVALPGPGPLADRLVRAGIPVSELPLRRLKRHPWPVAFVNLLYNACVSVPRLVKLIRAHGVDLVHANSGIAQLVAGPAARRCGIPAVWHCRDLAPFGLERFGLRSSARQVLAISHAVREHLLASGIPASRITLVPNGIDLKHFGEVTPAGVFRAAYGIAPERFLVATIGQWVPWKRHDLFLQAAAIVARQRPDTVFVIAGSDAQDDHPSYVAALRKEAARAGLADRVVFTGHLDDIRPLLADLDCLLHPAEREPFGRVIVEAMAAGKPVVAVRAGGPVDIVHSGTDGMLVPPGDSGTMAHAVLELQADPVLRARIGAAARQRAAGFDIRETARAVASVYDAILS